MNELPLPRGSNPGRFEELSRQRLVNCYYEPKDKKTGTIFFTAGMEARTLVSAGLFRGGIECDGIVYGVWSDGCYKITEGGTTQFLGYVTGSGRVIMAKNGAQLDPISQAAVSPAFTASGTYVLQAATGQISISGSGPATTAQIGIVTDAGDYYVIENDVLELQGNADLPDWVSICEINGYFVLFAEDGRFFNTGINDAKTISGLDVDAAGGSRDRNVAGVAHRQELWIYGTETTEIWRDVANTPGSPFERLPGAILPKGARARHSIREADNSLIWVAHDDTVCRSEGYQPKRISNFAVERSISSDPDKENIEADTWFENGHTFYAITGTNYTWVYDFATDQWHERESYGQLRWRGRGIINAFGVVLVGSRTDGYLHELQPDLRVEGSDPVVTKVRLTTPDAFPLNIDFHNIHIFAVTGRALVSGTTSQTAPKMTLRWSDTGTTFHGVRQLSLGAMANRRLKLKARQLGSSRGKIARTWEMEFSDPHIVAIDRVMINADV